MIRFRFTWTCVACCSLGLFILGCGGGSGHGVFDPPMIVGSGLIVSETRDLDPFHSVEMGIAEAEIVITRTGAQSVHVETDDNIIDEIRTYVAGGVLIIESQVSYDTDHGVRITLEMTDVQSLKLGGAGSMSASGLSSSGNLRATLTGAGNMTLSGTADTFHARLEGTGGIDAGSLRTRDSTIDLIGVGSCHVTVTDVLNATLAGTGDITYYYTGTPPVVNCVDSSELGDCIGIPI